MLIKVENSPEGSNIDFYLANYFFFREKFECWGRYRKKEKENFEILQVLLLFKKYINPFVIIILSVLIFMVLLEIEIQVIKNKRKKNE